MAKQNPKMKQDFFKFLSPQIMINILSRVPVRTTKSCKCVCKSWLDLIETREFVKSYLSKSARSLAIVEGKTSYRMVEFVDDAQNSGHHFHVVSDFKFPHHARVHSSANGLLFLFNDKDKAPRDLFICNPINGEYVKLPPPTETSSTPDLEIEHDAFGFGVSKISGQYKIVRIFHENSKLDGITQTRPMCEVYTLGTKSWRSIRAGSELEYRKDAAAAFVNGNLYWLVFDPIDKPQVSCLDLETELFTSFYPPFHRRSCAYWLSVLGDRLCFSDNAAMGEIVIWLMKKRKYGGENSWSRVYIIKRPYETFHFGDFPITGYFFPIKVFRDGDILFAQDWSTELYSYSKKTKTLRKCEPSEAWGDYCARVVVIYTPSFLTLETFGMENVSSFSDV